MLIRRGEQDILAIRLDTLLAVGSAFKLAVLATLLDEIESGRRRWEEVVLLDSAWRSVPSGILQDWHPGSPLALHTVAALMISRSDNTATDALIQLLGREQVERYGYANRPFLTTREFFHLLYSPRARSYSQRWHTLSENEKRRILTEIGRQPIPRLWDIETRLDIAPEDLQATWLFSLRELDTLMRRVEKLPLMGINPGLAQTEDWQHVAYKGGSFPGCLNMTTVVYSSAGERFFVGMTWNSLSPIREEDFSALYGGIFRLLRQGM